MPYLQFVYCDKCKTAPMDIDYKSTIESYYHDGRREKDNFINPATIVWDYLVYRCTHCGEKKKYTFRKIENKVREYFSALSEEYREYFDKLGEVDFSALEHKVYQPKPRKHTEERVRNLYVSKE